MATITKLLDLPNELLIVIFGYLSSADLIDAFIQIRSNRLKILINPFIRELDLTDRSLPWIQEYLPKVNSIYDFCGVRLRDSQLEPVLPLLSTGKVESVKLVSDSILDVLDQKKVVEQLTHQLISLSIDFCWTEGDDDLVSVLFNRRSNLQYLAIHNCTLFFDESAIHPCRFLKSLHIETEGTHHVFLLLKHLRTLETLDVKFISNECLVQPDPVIKGIRPCPRLRNVNITGCIRHLSHLGMFFATFGNTFEQVQINITTLFANIDGKILEDEFLSGMRSLKLFQLFIISQLNSENEEIIKTYQTARWQQFPPIICYFDNHTCERVTCTIPHGDKSMPLSNSAILSWHCNRQTNERFLHVQQLVFNVTTPVTLKSWQFIADRFPRLRKLAFIHSIAVFDRDSDDDDDEQRNPDFVNLMDDCLLSDYMVMALPSVRHLSINCRMISFDTVIFRHLLKLLPNLIHFKLSAAKTNILAQWDVDSEDSLLQEKLSCIRLVEVELVHQNPMSDICEHLSRLFPNAKMDVKMDFYDGGG